MNEQLGLLVELQKLDTKIITRSRIIAELPKKLEALRPPVEEARVVLEREQEKIAGFEAKKKTNEDIVKEAKERLKKLEERTASVTDSKSFAAHQKEIDSANSTIRKTGEIVDKATEMVANQSQRVADAQKMFDDAEAFANAQKERLEAQAAEAKESLGGLKSGRSAIVNKINKEYYDMYKELITTRAGLAVVDAHDEVCGGCNMNIMPQLFVHIRTNEEIISCPQCRRVLYYEEDQEQA